MLLSALFFLFHDGDGDGDGDGVDDATTLRVCQTSLYVQRYRLEAGRIPGCDRLMRACRGGCVAEKGWTEGTTTRHRGPSSCRRCSAGRPIPWRSCRSWPTNTAYVWLPRHTPRRTSPCLTSLATGGQCRLIGRVGNLKNYFLIEHDPNHVNKRALTEVGTHPPGRDGPC